MTNQRFPTTEPPPGDERDIPCLNCNYNLRGLTGDPRRCPECGALNPIDQLVIPDHLLRAQLRSMETLPTLCLASSLVFFSSIWMFSIGTATPCCVAALGAPLLWLVCAVRFGALCGEKPGWRHLLALYHLYGLGLAAAVVVMMILVPYQCARSSYVRHDSREAAGIAVIAASSFLLLVLGAWARRRWVARLRPFVLDEVQSRARHEARRLLRARLRQQDSLKRYRDAGL